MDARDLLLDRLVGSLGSRTSPPAPLLVGVDGVDGSGKTMFGQALVERLLAAGRWATSVSLDGFHRPRAERYAQGAGSPAGFFEDSYDLEGFLDAVVRPVRGGGDVRGGRRVRTAIFDHRGDRAVDGALVDVPAGGVLVVDGIFLHRDELADAWDVSVFLDVPFDVTFARMAVRDGCPADPSAPANRRYVEGQRLYLGRCRPAARADVVVENSDVARPRLVVDRLGLV